MKPFKPKNIDVEEQEEDDSEIKLNGISIGDIIIQSRKPIKNPAKVVSNLLKNKEISSYLRLVQERKINPFAQNPSYID